MRKTSLYLPLLIVILAGCSTPTATIFPTPNLYGTCTPDWATPTGTELVGDDLPTEATKIPSLTLSPGLTATSTYFGYTHQQPDGNRIVDGTGQIPQLTPVDIPLPESATWIVSIPWKSGSFWAVVLADGQVLGFQIDTKGWHPAEIALGKLEAGEPPLLMRNGSTPTLLEAPSILASSLTHAIPFGEPYYAQIFIETGGNLVRVDPNTRLSSALKIDALPDARILSDELGRLLLLSGPTNQYQHGVLGDTFEAGSFTLIQDPWLGEFTTISMPVGSVIEGIAPIWVDLNGDGEREIIITVSNAQQGAQILVFDETGKQIAAGPSTGQGFRWRHQIAAAPFGPNNEMELVDVLTPHLAGVVEFFRWEGDQLKVVAQLPGYTSHIIGTRNLDMAAAGDFDGDGHLEVLLPRQDREELGAIRHTQASAEVVWSLPLDGRLTTNIGAVTLADGSIAIGVGLENDILPISGSSLRIWHP